MRHFRQIENFEKIFHRVPQEFNKQTDKEKLAVSLGATMYTASTNMGIAESIVNCKYPGLTTNVWCLEDSLGDNMVAVAEGEINIEKQLMALEEAIKLNMIKERDIPLIFIRVRDPQQLEKMLKLGKKLRLVAGFNLPKFSSKNGEEFLSLIKTANEKYDETFYAMPILETTDTMYLETRVDELQKLKAITDKYKDIVLNIRLGGTDFSSLYSLRRGIEFTIYDIITIRDCISDILNIFGRASENYTVSGVVWEYFSNNNRMLKPQLRETPFRKDGEQGLAKREIIISREVDGLIKEVLLDKANGIIGKTIIHPTHIEYVNALQIVTYEEYTDAMNILNNQDKGVFKGDGGNKMNEVKPHYNWAKRIINRSNIYGVLNKDENFTSLF